METFYSYEEENISYWSRRAPSYSEVNLEELATEQRRVWGQVIRAQIREHFPERSPREIRVLDVGTGPGFFAILLAELGYSVTAVDYTAAMLKEAKKNAGSLARRIRFQQMNAEELLFEENTFDVIISRNLTWNLPHPEKAYSSWSRVLKSGGLLLNFDANWYRYLYDPQALEAHRADRGNVELLQVEDDTAGTDVQAMEAIAEKAPLSAVNRPQWDIEVLHALGIQAAADCDIWKRVWTRQERINNASTPMFLIRGEKSADSQAARRAS